MAVAFQPQPGDPVADPEVLHAAGVRAQVGPHLVQRPLDPGVDVQRVQPVQQQQALHQRVVAASLATIASRRPGRSLGQHGHDVRQAVPVQADQQADQFLGGRAADRCALSQPSSSSIWSPTCCTRVMPLPR